MSKFIRKRTIGGSPNAIGLLFLVIALAYCVLKGIIYVKYVKKDSSVRLASQFHYGRVILLPMPN